MKTDLSEISELYQSYIASGSHGTCEACPEPELLIKLIMAKSPKKERLRILRHAANCPECAKKLKGLLSISEDVDKFAKQLTALSDGSDVENYRGKAKLRIPILRKPIIAALVGVVGVALVICFFLKPENYRAKRGGQQSAVQVIFPVRAAVLRSDVQFRWTSLADADHYIIEVFDDSLSLIWRSDMLSGTELRLPETVTKYMVTGKAYYWTVTAITGNLKEVKSALAEFTVK